jgi:hypothetical protein
MKDLLNRIFGKDGITPPAECLDSFSQNFEDARSVEWFLREDHYESIFYKNELEYIALFSLTGSLLEYRKTLPVALLPEAIKQTALSRGEIMNSLIRNKGNTLEYEVIIRDGNLTRYVVVFSELGDIVEERKL